MPEEENQSAGTGRADPTECRERVSAELSWAMRGLTANLLRIVRGAGNPHEIGRQTTDLVQAFIAYQESIGHWPPTHELAAMLSVNQNKEWRARASDLELQRYAAVQQIIRGVLQITASRLIGQRTQESAGEHEMHEGIRNLDASIAEMRREREVARAPKVVSRARHGRKAKSKQ